MATYLAVRPWQVHYSDPIRGAAGDHLTLGRRDDEFPGWVWATAADGREGWVPEAWLRVEGESGVLLRDYTAAELPLEPGDVVSGELVEGGWLWATAPDGREGWAPLNCLELVRRDGRGLAELRPISFETGFTRWAEGSVLAQFGETHVLCNVTIENTLPAWLKNADPPRGWLTAEYAMLPRSTHSRTQREQRWPKGRTQEISRLVGRSLRAALDLSLLGERTLTVDCDVLQADGGTRTAAITGGWVAVALALRPLVAAGELSEAVLKRQVAAVSVGVIGDDVLLDLDYSEDAAAEVDLNVVMTARGEFIEVQGTAEGAPFSRGQLDRLLDRAAEGIQDLCSRQNQALG
jgi:ribonuclease PH